MKDPDDKGTIDMNWPVRETVSQHELFNEWMNTPFDERPPYWEWIQEKTGQPVRVGDTIKKS